jgi:hypothetical protein
MSINYWVGRLPLSLTESLLSVESCFCLLRSLIWREGRLFLRWDLHNLLLLPLTSTVIISFLPPSFWALLFIGAIATVQLLQNIHYTWTQHKPMLHEDTRDHNTNTNIDYTNEAEHARPLPTTPSGLWSRDARQTKHSLSKVPL